MVLELPSSRLVEYTTSELQVPLRNACHFALTANIAANAEEAVCEPDSLSRLATRIGTVMSASGSVKPQDSLRSHHERRR